jgi:hypothetical protein
MNYDIIFKEKENLFDVDAEEHLHSSLEEFLDNLLDTNLLDLDLGDSIMDFGKGMVNIKCELNQTYIDNDDQLITRQVFGLEFQADQSIFVELIYASNTIDEQKKLNENKFKYWISFKYMDDENHSFPWENDYYYEFIEDLTL